MLTQSLQKCPSRSPWTKVCGAGACSWLYLLQDSHAADLSLQGPVTMQQLLKPVDQQHLLAAHSQPAQGWCPMPCIDHALCLAPASQFDYCHLVINTLYRVSASPIAMTPFGVAVVDMLMCMQRVGLQESWSGPAMTSAPYSFSARTCSAPASCAWCWTSSALAGRLQRCGASPCRHCQHTLWHEHW